MSQKTQDDIERYKILYGAYADEIKNLWQRSIFLGAFMVLAWSGYGALQLKAIEPKIVENLSQSAQNAEQSLVYISASLGLCAIIIVLSWLWIAMAKGSKFVQEAHEAKIKQYSKKYKCNLFCDLNVYQKATSKGGMTKLYSICPLKSYRYSPSKINIALGWVSLLVSIVLVYIHLFIQTSMKEKIQKLISLALSTSLAFICPLIFVAIMAVVIHFAIKGKSVKTR